jgi:hypothetical protein
MTFPDTDCSLAYELSCKGSVAIKQATYLHLRNTRAPHAERSLARELMRTWDKGANTDELRALLEILVKIRTDARLKSRVARRLKLWQEQASELTRAGYEAVSGDDRDVELLLAMHCLPGSRVGHPASVLEQHGLHRTDRDN